MRNDCSDLKSDNSKTHQQINAKSQGQKTKNSPHELHPHSSKLKEQQKMDIDKQSSSQALSNFSFQSHNLLQLIVSQFGVFKEISKRIEHVAYTQNQAKDIAIALIEGIISLEMVATVEEKVAVDDLFSIQNITLIKNQQLFYYGLLDKLKQSQTQLSPSIKSRIYHRIANLKKETEIEQEWTNEYGIKCIKSNGYQILSESEIQQLVKYEAIADKIKQLGNNIYIKLEAISKDSEKILKLLSESMIPRIEKINQLKYNLEVDQVMQIADFARQTDKYYESGAFILLEYFAQSCKRLQNQNIFSQSIELLLEKAINEISAKYSIEEDPSEETEQQKQALKDKLEKYQNVKQCQVFSLKSQASDTRLQKFNSFACKIDQFRKNKNTSKISMIHNYFDKAYNGFTQGVGKALLLISNNQEFKHKDKASIEIIRKYFRLDSAHPKSFQSIFLETLSEKKMQIKSLAIVVDPLLQSLMVGLFSIEMKVWRKPLGKIINPILKNNKLSRKLKSVLLSRFFQVLSLPKESDYIQFLSTEQKQFDDKIFMEEFIKGHFQIEKAFQFAPENHRIFHRTLQLEQITFSKHFLTYAIQLKSKFVVNLVVESNCLKSIVVLRELFDFYFVTRRDKHDFFYDQFSYYYNWLKALLQQNKALDKKQLLRSQIAIIKAQQLLENDKPEQARQLLEAAQNVFQNEKKQEKIMECSILLYECFVKTSNDTLENCLIQFNHKVFKQTIAMGFQISGPLYADALWRICEFLWTIVNSNDKKLLFQALTIMAIKQLSRRSKKFIYALSKIQNQYGSIDEESLISINERIEQIKLYGLKTKGSEHLSKARWSNLIKLDLNSNEIGAEGCANLIRADWQHLTKIDLGFNEIGAIGCLHLSQSKWSNLTHLNLEYNYIGADGCENLIKARWEHLTYLNLRSSHIQANGCQHLSNSNWRNLTHLYLGQSNIGDDGCAYLSNADWKNLTHLFLESNEIRDIGCEYLSNGDWKNLKKLDLGYNEIGADGCRHLGNADWSNLTQLNLQENKIGAEGCKHLSKANWKHLNWLNLYDNEIKAEGCEHLSNAHWRNLNCLFLSYNRIGDNGCMHLSKAKWMNLTQIDLSCNRFGAEGCAHLIQADWKDLTKINLSNNKIGADGCERLCKADWKSLKKINLGNNKIGDDGCLHLSRAKWQKLNHLLLEYNNIGAEGCKYLSEADFNNLSSLQLRKNSIGDNGCLYLSKADWRRLNKLNLWDNNIGDEGCLYLSKANWKNLSHLIIRNNEIGADGCAHLTKADWKNLTQLIIGFNHIGDNGCLHLSKSDWRNLAQLDIGHNSIGADGCMCISKCDWRNLADLNLWNNNMADDGCAYISKASWKNLLQLDLRQNNIGSYGCSHLIKANLRRLTKLDLSSNSIGASGCEHLSKGNWKNLDQLNLNYNQLAIEDYKHLGKANWTNLTYLNLGDRSINQMYVKLVQLNFVQKSLRIDF